MTQKITNMAPKIARTQVLQANNTTVEVRGPAEWDDDVVAGVFTVVLTQIDEHRNVVMAIGASPHVFTKADDEWWVTVNTLNGGQLGLGDAMAAASVSYVDDDGAAYWYEWTLPTRLTRA